jgi:hypothetical protein
MELRLETRPSATDAATTMRTPGGPTLLLGGAPKAGEWLYRVEVGGGQAVIGFPKFDVIVGVGFEREEDWNTNLPSSVPARDIFEHIRHNRGPATATDEEIVEAIEMVRRAVARDRPGTPMLTEDDYAEARAQMRALRALDDDDGDPG